MDFTQLADLYEELEKTSSGNQLREILAEFFKHVPHDDLKTITYLTLGSIASDYESVVLQMADKSVLKAIASAGGTDLSKVKKMMQETGDAGLTAEKVLQKKPMTLVPVGKLTIHDLFDGLHKIATTSGLGSQDKKTNILVSLLQKASAKGAKYVCRIALGTLRMGVAEMTVLDALAMAFTGEKKNKEILEKTYNICPDVGVIAETLAKKGLPGLEKIEVHVGRPIKMMLAQRVQQLEDISKKIPGEFVAQGKYDGERVQAHKNKKGKISLFSRRLENITEQFPDLVEHLEKNIQAHEFVIEGEIIAVKDGKPLPFQTLMQRRRKYDVEEYRKKIPVQIKLFDLLYHGKSFLHEPHEKRLKELEKITKKGKRVTIADYITTSDYQEANEFFHKMLKAGNEGLIIKSQTGEYQAGTRGWNWIKWKKDYTQEMVDTFDLVIIGGFHGKGRRSGTYGALLCACYDEKNDQFLTLCKLGTGLTDEMLEELPKRLKKHEVKNKPARVIVKKEMEPDIWFSPEIVVEVLGAELTKSPFHTAELALRFPRFVRIRDKKAEQATSLKELEGMK